MSRFRKTVSIFDNEDAVKEEWVPEKLPEREDELDELEKVFMPIVNRSTPQNAFVYGDTGQGKTVATEVILDELQEYVEDELDEQLTVVKSTLQGSNTSYQAVGKLLTHVEPGTETPPKGLSYDDLIFRLFSALAEIGGYVVIVLDEVDSLGSDDDLLYEIPRARKNGRLENARVSLVGISNDYNYKQNLSPKVKDTPMDQEIYFAPYDAPQLQTILEQRKEIAFEDGVVEDDVIPLAAAYAAQDEGSARQALKFLYQAGVLARSNEDKTVTVEHLKEAREVIEQENIISNVTEFTVHNQVTLLALASLEAKGETPARTKQVYAEYREIAKRAGIDPLTSRSIGEKLPDFDTYSFATVANTTGGSVGGKILKAELDVDLDALLEAFIEVDRLSDIARDVPLGERRSRLT